MTAEEFLENRGWSDYENMSFTTVKEYLKEFAKYHVEKALQRAADLSFVEVVGETSMGMPIYEVDQESILNAYPLTFIK